MNARRKRKKPPPRDPPGDPPAPRRTRSRAALLLLLLVAAAAVGAIAAWRWWPDLPQANAEVPEIDLAGSPTAVVRAVQEARQRVEQSPEDADAWGRLGMVLFAHQIMLHPQVCFEQAERLDPSEFRWPYLRALCVQATDRELAARLFAKAAELRPDLGVIHNRLGELLLELERYDEAESHLRESQRLDSDQVRPAAALARLALARDRLPEALHWAEQAVALDVDQSTTHELLAVIHQRSNNRQAAAEEMRIAETLDDIPLGWHDPVTDNMLQLRRDPGWQYAQAKILLEKHGGQAAGEAIRLLQNAIAGDDRDPQVYCTLARTLMQVGQLPQAAQVLERAAELHPDSAEIRFQQGAVQFYAEQFQQAGERFRQAIDIKPDYALAHYNLGHVEQRLGNEKAALAAFEAAADYRPTYGDAHLNAGRILLRQGRADEARKHLEAAVRFAPANREARQLLDQARSASQAGPDDTP